MIETDNQSLHSFAQQVLVVVSHMVTLVIVQFILMLFVGIVVGMGPESTMEGWVEAFAIPPVLATIFYSYYRLRKQYVKVLVYSLLNLVLLAAEIYLYVEILKWDIAYGFMIIILSGAFIPLNYLFLNLLIDRKR
ncbi:hypothetical protein [Pontibacter mangrovi]|uniref:Uncharacterized protein n=1 Tax=Pontibacter mangrovi TaxID=2589816 RepID=A0A501W9T8_9BACT|nr:hypothetical protein [Pontibacter mangrovi]TPE43587.1 hypothetical protein FJM65_12590 [Pontibacter mangrovi]